MQKIISDYRQLEKMLLGFRSEGYKIDKSQEFFDLPGIFFIHKHEDLAYIEQLDDRNIYYLKRAYQDCWK